jgi:sugar lactone lactonase YvrE
MSHPAIKPRVLVNGFAMVESPRWHGGRLWFPHWGTSEIIAVDLAGKAEVVAHGPSGLGQAVGWLPDGRMLETGDQSFTGKLLAFDIADDGTLSARRVWAEGLGPDGICLDADGAIWTSTRKNECVRVAKGGEILDRIQLDRACFATMLGGPDRRTLFMMANQFLGPDKFDEMLALRAGQVLVVDAPAPGSGWP